MQIPSVSSSLLLKTSLPAQAVAAGPEDSFRATPSGYDLSYIDRNVRPQDDFYKFALGGYINSHPIPADKESNGVYPDVREKVAFQLHTILDDLAKTQAPAGSIERKLGDFYRSGMDIASIEAAGAKPLQGHFDRIDSISSRQGVQDEVARLHSEGFGGLFSFGSDADMKNPDRNIGEASQGGLGLPTKEYYSDPKKAEIREHYAAHVARMFQLLGQEGPAAEKSAQAVLNIESRLASASLAPKEMRDPKARYHIMDRDELKTLTPNFAWDKYFEGLGRPDIKSINVSTPQFFSNLNEMMGQVPTEDWKAYLKWNVINQSANNLSSPFEKEQFDFSKRLSGIQEPPPRFKRIVSLTDSYLGMGLSQKYVEKHFSLEAKAKAIEMIGNIKDVLRDRIEQGWMAPETKKEALAKIDTLGLKIGFPDKWKDYSGLQIDDGPFINNVLRGKAFEAREDLARIDTPVDRSEWHTTPSTVNANYSPSKNQICFPAGRLQPPFFDVNQDDALNYGATGATVGHEISHGFDDSGSQFDSQGRLRNWFTPEDLENFTKKADGVADQMSEFVFEGQKNDGKLVEGEAIADQGGVELAFEALQRSLAGKPAAPSPDGFTSQQRFYLGYALCRANNLRPESAHSQMSKDPHPLGPYRVNAPLSNEPSFFKAFDVKPGDPMLRPAEKRNHLWEIEQGIIADPAR